MKRTSVFTIFKIAAYLVFLTTPMFNVCGAATRGAVSKLIERLLQKSFVTRSEASDDRRFQDVRLTTSALNLVPKLAKLADENDEAFFHALSKAEREALTEVLKKLAARHGITKSPTE